MSKLTTQLRFDFEFSEQGLLKLIEKNYLYSGFSNGQFICKPDPDKNHIIILSVNWSSVEIVSSNLDNKFLYHGKMEVLSNGDICWSHRYSSDQNTVLTLIDAYKDHGILTEEDFINAGVFPNS